MKNTKGKSVSVELETIRKRSGGILRPADVVAFASDPKTALHARFEWDDTKAAHLYRLEQARAIIRCSVKVMHDDNPPIRAYVSLVDDRQNGESYRGIGDVMADAGLRETLLSQALREAQSWRQRYEHLRELAPIFDAIDRATEKPRAKRPRRQRGRKHAVAAT